MSKSHKAERSRILITDTPEQIKSKINSALTDSIPGITYDTATRPGISNLLDILSIFDAKGRTSPQLAEHYTDLSPRQLKELASDAVVSGLDGIRARFLELANGDSSHLVKIEAEGARKAAESAEETMCIVREAMGMAVP